MLLVFSLAVLMTACGESPTTPITSAHAQVEPGNSNRPLPRDIVTVELFDIRATVSLGGTAVPRHLVTLSAKAPGYVRYVAGPVGTRFNPGQILLELDSDILETQRRSAWANLAEASAVLQDANVQLYRQVYAPDPSPQGGMGVMQMFDRLVTRPASNMIGTSDSRLEKYAQFNSLRAGVERAQAGVMRAQSHIDEIEIRLDDTLILGPGHGVVLEKFVERGNIVQPGQPLMRVADTDDLLIRVEVPARIIRGVYSGMPVEVRLDALDMPLNTVVERIYPAADAFRHTVTVELSVPPGAPVAPGMYATVVLPDNTRQSSAFPVVPPSSLVWRGSQPGVFFVNTNGTIELRLIRAGQKTRAGIVVLSGLNAGDRILASPPVDLRTDLHSSAKRG